MKKIILAFCLTTFFSIIHAQNIGISTTGGVPDASAGLDIDFSNKGLLVPRVALTGTNVSTPITTPATSLLVYNTATVGGANAVSPGFYYWGGAAWLRLTTGVDTDDQTLSTNGDTLFIADGNFVIIPNTHTLDSAYDAGGRGAGRFIIADSGAVIIQGEDGFQVTGTNGSGEVLSLSGAESKMFFYPRKSAFRAGEVGVFGSGSTWWDDDSIGNYSFAGGSNIKVTSIFGAALGYNQNVTGTAGTALGTGHQVTGHVATAFGGGNVSSGLWTTATGVTTVASGEKSFSMGEGTNAYGGWSLAAGRENDATGESTVTFGRSNNAIANYSYTTGFNLLSPSYHEFVSGRFNDTGSSNSNTTWVGTERLFSLGNGTNNVNRNNAFIVYKDGNAYLNGNLTLSDGTDSITLPNTDGTVGQVMITDGNGLISWADAPSDTTKWSINGNYGTNPSTNFIGTRDNNALTIRVNDTAKVRIETNGTISTLNTGLSVFVGENAGLNDDLTTNRNTFIGNDAGRTNISGFYNTAFGEAALRQNTTANYNSAIGAKSLYFNTTGTQNVGVGFEAIYRNTTGSDNVGVGTQSLYNNTTGTHNTAIGHRSAFNNTTGEDNTSLGRFSLEDNTTGNYNTAIGSNALANNKTANANTAAGYETLLNDTTGAGNTANGYQSMYTNSTGNYNAALGYRTLYNNTVGNFNVAVGISTLYSATSASNNTAIGYRALYSDTTGYGNTASGRNALYDNSSGRYNSAYGYNALSNNTTGIYNTAIGMQAGDANFTGDFNTFVGYDADANNSTYDESTALGYNTQVTASNQVRIGTGATSIGGPQAWTNTSDARFKENVQDNVEGLPFILGLEPVTYNLNHQKFSQFISGTDTGFSQTHYDNLYKERQIGFLAQDVEQLADSLNFDFHGVDKPKNDKDVYGLRYAEFVPSLVKAVQEQQAVIDSLNQKIATQKPQTAQDFGLSKAETNELFIPFNAAFIQTKNGQPIVTVSAMDLDTKIVVTEITDKGFTVQIQSPKKQNSFSWIAMANAK